MSHTTAPGLELSPRSQGNAAPQPEPPLTQSPAQVASKQAQDHRNCTRGRMPLGAGAGPLPLASWEKASLSPNSNDPFLSTADQRALPREGLARAGAGG
jgi:hypothetical protein